MDNYSDPARAAERLSNQERDAAVGSLSAAQAEGRLDDKEFADRAAKAKAAVTRGDLAPLFADLPNTPPAPPYAGSAPAPGYGNGWNRRRPLGGAVGATIMALTPFIALGLFFFTGFSGGWIWAWAWFLIIPVAGIIIYGPDGRDRRYDRDRF
ncbi:hypothetical protein BH11ACT4_BH11ACT4_24830 [soil metagenome]